MKWFFKKKDCFQQRGILTQDQLSTMARNGSLDESDLLFSEATGGKWVRANTIPDLFPSKAPEPNTPAHTETLPRQSPTARPAPGIPYQKQKSKTANYRSYLAVLAIALLAIIALVMTGVLKKKKPIQPTPQLPQVITEETNVWAEVESDVLKLIQSGRVKEADTLIFNYTSECGTNELSLNMQAKLNQRIKQDRLKELYLIFKKNEASNNQLKALVDLSSELDETSNLVTTIKSSLTAKTAPSYQACQSILSLGRILNDRELQESAVIAMGEAFNNSSSIQDTLKMVNLYLEYQMPERAVSCLQMFTQLNPQASEAWLELAALLALQGNKEDDCLSALKQAVQTGGDPVREKARNDRRFDSVRETWTFKWQTR